MKEAIGNLWDSQSDAIVITTNGFVKKNGECVMGRGCAKEAAQRRPEVLRLLGTHLLAKGNNVYALCGTGTDLNQALVSFPVKPEINPFLRSKSEVVPHMRSRFNIGDQVPGWACVADVDLITKSAHQLVELTNRAGWKNVALPRPGCGAGELSWIDVKPVLISILDDRFTCWNFT